MGLELGAMLVEHAGAPMRDASGCLAVRRVKEALLELTAEKLQQALTRGVAEVAGRIGVKPRMVEAALPWEEINAILPKLTADQPVALATWNQHAGRLGGFLTGIVDVTMEKGLPDAGWYLDRLAAKVSRDRELSEPIDAFAADVTAWDECLKHCARRVDAVPAFASAYQWKRTRRVLFALLGVSVAGVGLAYPVRVHRCRARVDEVLARPDTCANDAEPADLARARPEQLAKLRERQEACDAERLRAEHERSCDEFVAHVEAGALTAEDPAGPTRPLLERMAKGTLAAADLVLEPSFPCSDRPSSARLWPAFVKAAAASTQAWKTADAISPRLAETLRTKGPPLPPEALQTVGERAEITAHRALISGDRGTIEKAVSLCGLDDAIGLEQGPSCKRLLVILPTMRR